MCIRDRPQYRVAGGVIDLGTLTEPALKTGGGLMQQHAKAIDNLSLIHI